MLNQDELINGEQNPNTFAKNSIDRADLESKQLSYTDQPSHPTTLSERESATPPSPEEAREEGWVDTFIDGTSDAVTGLVAGVGYGIDNIAESASHLLNHGAGAFGMETPEYEAKYISAYMDGLKRKGMAGDVAESIGKFMIGWMPWTRGIGLMAKGMQAFGATKKVGSALAGGTRAGRISSNFIASTLAGGTAFSPDYQNMANHVQKMDGYSGGVISEAFATNPNDPRWKNRLRTGLIDGGFGAVADLTLVPLLKAMGKGVSSVAKDPVERLVDQLHTFGTMAGNKAKSNLSSGNRGVTHLSRPDGSTKFGQAEGNQAQAQFDASMVMPKVKKGGENAENVLRAMEKDGSLTAKFNEAKTLEEKSILANNIAEQLGRKKNMNLGSVEVGNIKWNKGKGGGYHTTVNGKKWSIKQNKKGEFILKQGKNRKASYPTLNHAKERMAQEAGIDLKKTIPRRTHEQLYKESQKLYDEVGLDSDVIKNLPDNMGWNDTQMFAFGKLIQNTQLNMINALKKHASTSATDASHKQFEADALSAIANHADALTFLQGAKTAVARSFGTLKEVNKMVNKTIHADHIGSPEIVQLIKASNIGGSDINRMTQMILHAYETNGSKMGSKALVEGLGKNEGGGWNQFVEAWINQGLLSNPATHALNTFSGLTNLVGHVGSQVTGAFISKLPFVENKILFSEAFGSMYGMMAGLNKAMRLSLRASITNQQVVTKGAKIENHGFKHLASEHIGKGIGGAEDLAIGLGVDLIGTLNRIPGRFLLMEDEFVKSIAYDTMLHSKAWKYAWGVKGKNSVLGDNTGWLMTRQLYKDIVNAPRQFKDDMGDFHAQAQDLSNLVTFQRDVGKMVNQLSGIMQDHPYLKLFVPFLKVLTNIPKYVVQHSPLGLGMQNEAFKQGGTARMLEIGRMGYGTMMMMYGAHLYNNGNLKGTGETDFTKMMNQKDLGTDQAMSLRVGDQWVGIGRIAPLVNNLSFGADMAKAMDTWHEDPEDLAELVGQMVASGQNNLISGTWAPNLHKLLGVIAEPRDQGKQWSRAVNSLVGTLQPAFVRAKEKRDAPTMSEMKSHGWEGEDIGKSQYSDRSKPISKFMSVSSHTTDAETNIYPKVNLIGDDVKHHDGAGILNNPLVSFLTFKKANDNKVLKHLFGGTDSKTQMGRQGKDLDLPIKPLTPKVMVGKFAYKMTPEEFYFYSKAVGKGKAPNGLTLVQNWEYIFNSELYKKMPPKEQGSLNDRTDWMMNAFSQHKKYALQRTIKHFQLENKARDDKIYFNSQNKALIDKRQGQPQ
jgi:hypothetical protein